MSHETQNESQGLAKQSSTVTILEPASTNSTRHREIYERLGRGKEYREAFVESEINIGIPFQIKAMREAREWTQKELGSRSAKQQSVISQLETPGYGNLTLSTLKKLAAAFDVALMVRFVSFRELVSRAAHLSDSDMKIPSYGVDRASSTVTTTSALITQSQSTASGGLLIGRLPPRAVNVRTSANTSEETVHG
ncbi:MAG TPA: helix-turn-helix transcriptional regulator [Gammaproteobacteria bacterium]|nr:helix-turn-helix transcriptional regulator [Gammaproteobacteria bacterium]